MLHENTTVGNQSWSTQDPTIDFSKTATLEGTLLVNSSNYVPNVGDGSGREGYYLFITDINSWVFDIGLASNGFLINNYPAGRPFMPYSIAGGFHTYMLTINDYTATFSVDGKVVQSGIAAQDPSFIGPFASRFLFGGAAGASVSNTELREACVTDSATPCLATTTPEPKSLFLLLAAAILIGIHQLKMFKSRRRQGSIKA